MRASVRQEVLPLDCLSSWKRRCWAAAPPAALPAPKAAGAWLPGEGIGVGEIGGSGCPGGGMVSPASDAYGPVCGVIEGGADGPAAVKPVVAGVVAAGGAVP